MPTPPRRRWFQFGLRTMFVGVSLLSCVLAWVAFSLNWIRQRDAIRHGAGPLRCMYIGHVHMPPRPAINAPGLLWMFGEKGDREFTIIYDIADQYYAENNLQKIPSRPLTEAERQESQRIAGLFPESKINVIAHRQSP